MTASVGRRVVVTFAVMMLIILAHNLVLFYYFAKTEAYGPFLELAGRQRFLAQRLGVLVERARTAHDARHARLIEATIKSLDEGLTLLERGGETAGRSYPPAPAAISGAIEAQRNVWTKLDTRLANLADARGAPWHTGTLDDAEAIIDELTVTTFAVVDELEGWRSVLRRNLLYAIVATSLVALVTLLAALRRAWDKLVIPMRELRDEALRVSENGSYTNSGDELGLVSTVVNEMSQSVGRLRSERTQVEQELRRVEADYQSVFDNAVAGIFQFNAAGELLLANPAMARVLGYDSPSDLAERVGSVHRDVFVEPQHEARVRDLSERQGTIESQTQMFRKDGSILWALESSAIVRRDGNDYCCESVVVDITAMKEAQEGMKELSGLLLDSQERERRRIARELHDSTGQLLATLEMNVSRLKDFLEGAVDTVSTTTDLAAQCSRDIRSMSYLLHPPLLDELGLVYAVRDYAGGFEKRAGVKVELDLPQELERLSQDAETALFRVIQEALTNVHRHARSPVARIRLMAGGDEIVVDVEDEGCGIPPERLESRGKALSGMGVGMRGMEERLLQLGGRLTVTSGRSGTLVRAHLPRTAAGIASAGAVTRLAEDLEAPA